MYFYRKLISKSVQLSNYGLSSLSIFNNNVAFGRRVPLVDPSEARLLLMSVHICNEAYAGDDDFSPDKNLKPLIAAFPEFSSIKNFRSFEPGSYKDEGVNRAIAFNMSISHLNSIGLGKPNDKPDDPQQVTVVAVRGTHTPEEILQDIKVICGETAPSTHMNGLVGKGFAEGYARLRGNLLLQYIQKIHTSSNDSNGRLLVIGHSLGGAIGQLLSIDLKKMFPASSISLITFGQPRTLTKDFASGLGSGHVNYYKRMVNAQDPVPRHPEHGYVHCGLGCLYQENTGGRWDSFPDAIDADRSPADAILSLDVSRHRLETHNGYVACVTAGYKYAKAHASQNNTQ